ncbi:MAG: NAD(+) synthase [Bacteroidales bacterium]
MSDFGFFRVAAVVPTVKVADVKENTLEICRLLAQAEEKKVSLAVFPELSVTGYTCADLFGQNLLISKAEDGITFIKKFTRGKHVTAVVGAPVRVGGRLYNSAVVIRNGVVKGIVPKIYLPTYDEYYESRWFASGADFLSKASRCDGSFLDNGKDSFRECFGGTIQFAGAKANISPNLLFNIGKAVVGIELCEDLWTPLPPSSYHCLAGANVIANLSGSNEVLMKHDYRKGLISQQSARTISGYVYSSCGWGESTQDLVFAGEAMICENGSLMAENKRFRSESSMIVSDIDLDKLSVLRQKKNSFYAVAPDGTRSSEFHNYYSRINVGNPSDTDFDASLLRKLEAHPFIPSTSKQELDVRCKEITSIQVTGLATRLSHIGCKTAVIGISGGLDSTLALIITALAFDKLGLPRKNIIGITMPGFGTTKRTHDNADDLMASLGITGKEISIAPAVTQHFKDIGHDPHEHDTTYENSQARERTQILMDVANKTGGIVVGTGDLSESALGWATYNGDHISMYAVNASIPKTLVVSIIKWIAQTHSNLSETGCKREVSAILLDIIDTPISPELTPADASGKIIQLTEDLVGPYELHDFFLYNLFRFGYPPSKLLFLAKKAFAGVYDDATIEKWLKTFVRRFFSQQFKRSCMPDGPKVGSVSLSPRGDWRMPSDAWSTMFSEDI